MNALPQTIEDILQNITTAPYNGTVPLFGRDMPIEIRVTNGMYFPYVGGWNGAGRRTLKTAVNQVRGRLSFLFNDSDQGQPRKIDAGALEASTIAHELRRREKLGW